ncbi:MAG: HEPN domain-containing protein, partial [Bradyrhizobium sp.]
MNDSLPPEDRTPAIGLFNFARSYWRSSEQLRVSKPDVTHPDAPILFLFYQAIELYLKAFLRNAGYDLKQLKGISHQISKAAQAAKGEGLQLIQADFELLSLIDSYDNVIRTRYITTGAYSRPEDEELSDFCQHLDQSVGKRL